LAGEILFTHKGIQHVVAVVWYQVVGGRVKSDKTAVGRHRRLPYPAVALLTLVGQRHPVGHPAENVVPEDVVNAVGVTGHQVGGAGSEHHHRPAVSHVGQIGSAVALHAIAVNRHALGHARQPVVDKHVRHAVGIVRHQVG